MNISLTLSASASKISRLRMAGLSIPILVAALLSASQAARADDLTFCGVTAAPGTHTVVANCAVPGGAIMTGGTATEYVGSNYDFILTSFTITDNQAIPETGTFMDASNKYMFIGYGSLTASLSATWTNGPFISTGLDNVGSWATATSFDNNSALTPLNNLGVLLPGTVVLLNGSGTNNGDYGGSGTLQQWFTYTLSPGASLAFPIESEAEAVSPEPGTLTLLASGLLGLAGIARRKLRRG
jgi:hypothetical protein